MRGASRKVIFKRRLRPACRVFKLIAGMVMSKKAPERRRGTQERVEHEFQRRRDTRRSVRELAAHAIERSRQMTTQTGQEISGAEQWQELAQQLRVDSIRCSGSAGSGHPTSSMSAADLMAVLMSKYLRYDFDAPENPANDRLIFSKGHASPLLYSIYKAAGAISKEDLMGYRRLRQPLRGTPNPPDTLGRRGHRLAGPGTPPRTRLRAGEQIPGQTGLPHLRACAATPRWPKAPCGRPSSTLRTTSWATS